MGRRPSAVATLVERSRHYIPASMCSRSSTKAILTGMAVMP
jgi:hypothetical protein